MNRTSRMVAVAAICAAGLVLSGVEGVSFAAAPHDGHSVIPNLGPLVSGRAAQPVALNAGLRPSAAAALSPHLPAPGAFTVSLAGKAATPAVTTRGRTAAAVSSAWSGVGSTGLSAAQARATSTGATTASAVPVAKAKVEVLDPASVSRAGLTGLVLRVTRADGNTSAAPLAVQLPSGVLDGVFGAGYSSRAQWVQLPGSVTAAALSAATVRPSAVAVAHRPAGSTVLTPTVSGSATLLAATGSPVSGTGSGTWAATSLKTSATWQVDTQSGDFDWSYPFRVPPAAAGPTPSLALSYSSGSTDGETVSTNNQSSVVGEGWELSGTGFIERSFNGCAADGSGLSPEQAASGDLCWNGDNDTISFGGHSGVLVPTGTTGRYRVQGDDGSRVDYVPAGAVAGCADGGHDNGCWRLTTEDGTQYFFGRSAASAWTVPVFGDDAGEPCHATTFATSSCSQVWRWNLDYVQDLHGNAEQFVYHTEPNYYHRDGGALVQYVRGGYLTEVDYGMRAGSATVTQKVALGYDTYGRCAAATKNTTTCTNVTGSTFATPATPGNYPDVPWDQNCVAGGACTGLISPTFWTAQMLDTVTTSALVGATMTTAESWTLNHNFDNPGDTSAASMWLASIAHPGVLTTTFGGQFMDNRVWSTHAVGGETVGPLSKRRMTTITTDTSAQILIGYDTPDCTAAMVSGGQLVPSTNNHRCFPQWWAPPGNPIQLDWFHKYRVKSLIQVPMTGGSTDPNLETDYVYTGSPAWRFDQSAATLGSQRTWSVFAGYSAVEVRQGDPNTPATQQTTDYRYLQGMDNDPDGPTSTPTSHHRGDGLPNGITVTAAGHTVTDSLWWAGRTLETTVRIGSSGGTGQSTTPVLSDTVTVPWASAPTGTGSLSYSYTDPASGTTYSGSFNWAAYLTGDASSSTTSTLSDGTTRTTTTSTSYDSYGRVTQVSTVTPDAGSTCTNTSYVDDPGGSDTALWLLDLPAQVSVVNVDCSATPSYPANAVSATRYYYDGSAGSGSQGLSYGDLTRTDAVTSYSGSSPVWSEQSHAATGDFDALGRQLTSYDANNHPTNTAYTPAGAGPVTSSTTSTVHSGATWGTTTTAFNTLWGVPTTITDQNGNVSTASYDSLGRLSQVWLPDRPQAAHTTSPSIAYGYTDTSGMALAVTTTTLNSEGGNLYSYQFMDGLGRPIQTQQAIDGTNGTTGSHQITGTVITDTYYDGAGRTVLTDNPFGTTSVMPSTTRFDTSKASQVPSQIQTSYDGAGRPVTVSQLGLNAATGVYGALWNTTNSYLGADRVNSIPPAGGTYTSTFTDSRGRTEYLDRYTTNSFSGTKERTSYGYDARGKLTSMTDAAGNRWSWTFDQLGRQVAAVDPDTGSSTTTYDAVGNVTDTTDGDGHKLRFGYDDLNRKVSESEWQPGPAGYAQVAGWSFDTATLGKGLPASSTRYVGSTPTVLGTAYSSAVSAYNAIGKPLSNSVTIPPWAGSATTSTYTWSHTYDQAGNEASVTDPAAGGINLEKITTTYDPLGQVTTVGGYSGYLANVLYTHTNQVATLQATNGSTEVDRSYTYDDATARLTSLTVLTSASTNYQLAGHRYTYNNSGELLSDANTADGKGTDTQCYNYDGLQELSRVWTPASNSCAGAPSSSSLGGPAPYWSDYYYDLPTGNRVSTVSHAVTGSGTNTHQLYVYPAAGGAHPHGVGSVVTSTAPASGGSYVQTGSVSYGYDAGGNTVTRPGQTLAWNSQNQLASTTVGSATGSNVYDADGSLLLSSDPSTGSTLYLGDTELHVAPGSSVTTAVRTYSAYGMPLAERVTTPAAPTTATQYWLDPGAQDQNTVGAEVKSSTLATTHRYFDPFGNVRGAAPAWTSPHTFLNAPSNTFTSTVHLGARDYDPVLGRFLSVDSVLDPSNPQQNNGYSYAWNNPVTNSDPTGLRPAGDGGGITGSDLHAWQHAENQATTVAGDSTAVEAAGSADTSAGSTYNKAVQTAQDAFYDTLDQLGRAEGAASCASIWILGGGGGCTFTPMSSDQQTDRASRHFDERLALHDSIGLAHGDAARGLSKADADLAKAEADLQAAENAIAADSLGGLSSAEQGVASDARSIYGSKALGQIRAANAAGASTEVTVNGTTIIYEPGMAESGMTLFGENGFVLGRGAFASDSELAKTIAHESYRLATSASSNGISGGLAKSETDAAFNFANQVGPYVMGGP